MGLFSLLRHTDQLRDREISSNSYYKDKAHFLVTLSLHLFIFPSLWSPFVGLIQF